MRDGSIHPKVLDFGISKAPRWRRSPASGHRASILGSPSYFAPEQVDDPKAISAASDQYALGVILYECVTGRLPYEGSSLAAIFQAIMAGTTNRRSPIRPDLPEGFQNVIARAMSLAPGDRSRRQGDGAGVAGARVARRRACSGRISSRRRPAPPQTLVSLPRSGHRPDARSHPPSAVSVTASMPADQRCHHAANGRSLRWSRSAPISSPPAGRSAGALAVALSWAFVVGTHGRTRAPISSQPPSPPSAVTSRRPRPAAASHRRPARGRDAARGGAQAKAVAKPEAASTPRTARSAGPAHRPRFGPNRAPLIE